MLRGLLDQLNTFIDFVPAALFAKNEQLTFQTFEASNLIIEIRSVTYLRVNFEQRYSLIEVLSSILRSPRSSESTATSKCVSAVAALLPSSKNQLRFFKTFFQQFYDCPKPD